MSSEKRSGGEAFATFKTKNRTETIVLGYVYSTPPATTTTVIVEAPSRPPPQAPAPDHVPEATPEWVRQLVAAKNGLDARCVITKKLTRSDLDDDENPFLIPCGPANAQLRCALNAAEREAVGFPVVGSGPGGRRGCRFWVDVHTRYHGVFKQLKLVRWITSAVALNGRGWNCLKKRCRFTVGTEVGLWSFRPPTEDGDADDDAAGVLNLIIGAMDAD